jgi:hypothetical protein
MTCDDLRKSTIARYAELRSALDLNSAQMSEYFKVKSIQGQSSQGKVGRVPGGPKSKC